MAPTQLSSEKRESLLINPHLQLLEQSPPQCLCIWAIGIKNDRKGICSLYRLCYFTSEAISENIILLLPGEWKALEPDHPLQNHL